jgi:hypothetical protein
MATTEKQLAANHRNAQHSTGPKTDAGKQASRLNAVTHGLLAKQVVISVGDYKEDEGEFAGLLAELREDLTPVGMVEDLEVQKIAVCYWRKARAVRYEHGAIRKRTGDMRGREELRRESYFDVNLPFGSGLEDNSRGIQHLIEVLEQVKKAMGAGTVSADSRDFLEKAFPGEFAHLRSGIGDAGASPEDRRQVMAEIDEQLRRLRRLLERVIHGEELNIESKISAAALPGPAVVGNLVRYEASNERELDRAYTRLDRMQERRRTTGGPHPTN